MSFATEVKTELCRAGVERGCCALAEALGVLLFANTFTPEEIRIVTESPDFAQRLPKLFRKGFGVGFDRLPGEDAKGKLQFGIRDTEKIKTIYEQCGFSVENSVSLHVNFALLEKECCKRAFFRGAFLSGGAVTDPEKCYHLELSTIHRNASREAENLLRDMELPAKLTERKGSGILYFKQSDSIETFLTTIGCPIGAMAVMEAKINKNWRNIANRKTNCDSANLDKTVAAAGEQIAAIAHLREEGLFEQLPPKIRETAVLREEYPEVNLAELADLHQPPLTKSAVNHRLRKILRLAKGAQDLQEDAT
ncbi:MAG: DNA-binding protein WhiA [Oscillospiraceae bacterium]|nr:DNA-binding protein WhiA [Oscillospiraceae bacterium]